MDHPVSTAVVPLRAQRFRGTLLGGAVGDALGAAVEFMTRVEILAWFGPAGIRDFVPVDGRLGTITDDTQLTLFCGEALLRAHAHGVRDDDPPGQALERSRAYLRWLLTQGERHALLDAPQSWLMGEPGLFHQRGPGQTCLGSLRAMKTLGDRARNASKGCGGIMRIAPVGLFHSHRYAASDRFDASVFAAGTADAALTHGHACGHLPAGYFALLIALIASDVPLDTALARCRAQLLRHPGHQAVVVSIDHALNLAYTAPGEPGQLASLGHGWVGEEALAMALYCAVGSVQCNGSLETAVTLAVNHDGDSDSTGALTGSLLGALHGEVAIPARWLRSVELAGVLGTLADDLASAPDWPRDADARKRYGPA
jgi:ADP-ribosylglycohydrolase